MKKDEGVVTIPVRRCACALLLLVAMAAMLAPSSLHAGACMDGKLLADEKYLWNDPNLNIVKKITIEYSAAIAPSVKSRVECAQASESSTDLTCTITLLYAYVYFINGKNQATIKNPGMFCGNNNVPEKICRDLDLAVYYLSNGKKL